MSNRKITISVDIVSDPSGTAKVKNALKGINREVDQINAQTARNAKTQARVIESTTKQRVDSEIRQEKRLERERKEQANKFIQSINRVRAASSGVGRSAFAGGALGGFLGSVSAAAISTLTSSLTQAGRAVFEFSSKMQQSQVSFASLMGNAQLAAKHIKELKDLTLSFPLEFSAMASMSQRLQGAGMEAKKIVPLIKDIGNVAAATGELTSTRLEGIGTAFAQIASKSRVSAEEMEQLAERGIPAWQILSKEMGVTMGAARKMAEQGQITSDQLFAAFQKFSRMNYGDAMKKQAGTFSGAMQQIENIVMITAQTAFEPFYKKVSSLAAETAKRLQAQKGDFNRSAAILGESAGKAFGFGFMESAKWLFKDLALIMHPAGPGQSTIGSFLKGLMGGAASSATGGTLQNPITRVGDTVANYGGTRRAVPSNVPRIDNSAASGGSTRKGFYGSSRQAERDPVQEANLQRYQQFQSILKGLQQDLDFYGDKSEEAAVKQQLLNIGITEFNSEAVQEVLNLARQKDARDAATEATKNHADALLEFARAKSAIDNEAIDSRISAGTELILLTEEIRLGRELNDVEKQTILNQRELIAMDFKYQREGFSRTQIEDLIASLGYEQSITLELQKQVQVKKDQIDATKAAKDAQQDADRKRLDDLENYRQEQQRLFEDTARGFEDMLTDLADGNFKSIWDRLRRQMLDSFIKPASQYLAALFAGQGIPGMQTAGGFGGQQGGLGSIFGGLFGGGSQGPGGTPNFNPNIDFGGFGGGANASGGGQGGGGSMWGGWDKFKGWGQQLGGGQGKGLSGMLRGMGGGSKMAGIGAGLGMAGTMIGGALGGKLGNFISMTGMGASFGAQFGPWGALIGAGIGAAAGGIMALFGGDNSTKKLKQAASSEFGINVKDKSVLKSLKQIGEGYFGKGQAGKNAIATVRSEEGMNVLRAYADASGQSGLKIDRLNYGDENWSGNQFGTKFGGFRANGGAVQAGFSYVVGERRPEVFTPSVSGHISPTVGAGSITPQLLAGFVEASHRIADALESLDAVPFEHVVAKGAAGASRQLNEAVQSEYGKDNRATEQSFRNTGQWN